MMLEKSLYEVPTLNEMSYIYIFREKKDLLQIKAVHIDLGEKVI